MLISQITCTLSCPFQKEYTILKELEESKHKLTARASDTFSRCFVKFETALAMLRFVTYIRSENLRP